MKKILLIASLALILACGSIQPAKQVAQPAQPAAAPAVTADALLGSASGLMWYFEHQHQFECDASSDHWRCLAPGGLVKLTLFNDPVTEATISVPLDAAASKPSKYVVALLHQTDLDNTAWDWLVSQMKQPEMSKDFGDRRLTTQMDDEGWLVTVETLK